MPRTNPELAAIRNVVDKIDGEGWVIVYNAEPRPDQRALMESMGLRVVVDPDHPAGVLKSPVMETPAHKATETVNCNVAGCTEERRYTRGVGAGKCTYHGKPLFQELARRQAQTRRPARPREVRPLPEGSPLNKQSVQLGLLGTRVETAAKRRAAAKRKFEECDALLTAELDQFTAQLRDTIARVKALRELD